MPRLLAFHHRVFPVHILQDTRMDHHVVETRIEHRLLCFRTPFHLNGLQGGVPCIPRILATDFKVLACHFLLQVLPGILDAHEAHAHTHLNLLALLTVEVEPSTDVVAADVLPVLGVYLVLACRVIPFCLGGHRTHLLPVAALFRCLAHPHHKVDREHTLREIAERTLQLGTLHFPVVHETHGCTCLVGQTFAQVQQDVALSLVEGEPLDAGPLGSCRLHLDVVLGQRVGVVARCGDLILVSRAIVVVVHVTLAAGRHHQQGAYLRTAHAAQAHMGQTREETVGQVIWSGPPTGILVVLVHVRPHHVERSHGHQTLWNNRPRIARSEVRRPDERIHIVHRFLCLSHGLEGNRCQ